MACVKPEGRGCMNSLRRKDCFFVPRGACGKKKKYKLTAMEISVSPQFGKSLGAGVDLALFADVSQRDVKKHIKNIQ